jgi:hypothetical protein
MEQRATTPAAKRKDESRKNEVCPAKLRENEAYTTHTGGK